MLGYAHAPENTPEKIDRTRKGVRLLHSGMDYQKRGDHIDEINNLASTIEVIISPGELIAEGYNMAGVNKVIMAGPTPKETTGAQAMSRPKRPPQMEKTIEVYILSNNSGHVDQSILRKQGYSTFMIPAYIWHMRAWKA
ncbi:hypothetical protein IQ07DRAFT_651244 [Pyrenochaeta sp. DS3sAY3a]|nr:hypothetical protein IQ07DRAFT_651244 [Pyrenochaeta sp. DS3sAY3a]